MFSPIYVQHLSNGSLIATRPEVKFEGCAVNNILILEFIQFLLEPNFSWIMNYLELNIDENWGNCHLCNSKMPYYDRIKLINGYDLEHKWANITLVPLDYVYRVRENYKDTLTNVVERVDIYGKPCYNYNRIDNRLLNFIGIIDNENSGPI